MTANTAAEKQLLENFRKLNEDEQARMERTVERAAKMQPFRTYLKGKGLSTQTTPIEELHDELDKFRTCQA